jgi:hypothetical protein
LRALCDFDAPFDQVDRRAPAAKRRARAVHGLNFASLKFFLFFSGAKFGEFRPSAPAQVVCWFAITEYRWGEIE